MSVSKLISLALNFTPYTVLSLSSSVCQIEHNLCILPHRDCIEWMRLLLLSNEFIGCDAICLGLVLLSNNEVHEVSTTQVDVQGVVVQFTLVCPFLCS